MRVHRPLLAMCFFARATAELGAIDFHVVPPPAGSDANPGTVGAPLATIQAAADRTRPGDSVIVHTGTYAGFRIGPGRGGAPGLPVTFRADLSAGPVIIDRTGSFSPNPQRSRIDIDSVSFVVIDGFEVVGTADQRTSKAGIRIVCAPDAGSSDITIRHVNSHHHGQWGLLSGHVARITVEDSQFHDNTAEHGVYLSNSGDGHIVRRCRISGNSSNGIHINADASQGGDGIITGVVIEDNVIFGNGVGSTYIDTSGNTRTVAGGGSGINCDGVRDSVIRNNLLYDNHASGISLYRIDGLLPASGNLVANNTIINGSPSNTAARWCLNISDASAGNTIFNNILLNYHGFRGSIIISPDALPGFASDANILMSRLDPDGNGPRSLADWQTATGQDQHSLALPAAQWSSLFAGLAANDFQLALASPARDTGVAIFAGRVAPGSDLLGTPRPQGSGFDVGAYEVAICPADFNGDGALDPDDLGDFINCYFEAPPCPTADFNADGSLDPDDLGDFINAYFDPAGC